MLHRQRWHYADSMRNWIHVLLLHATLLPAAVGAAALHVVADRIEGAGVEATRLDLSLDWPDGSPKGEFVLRARTLRLGDTGLQFQNAEWRCSLERADAGWRCEGTIEADGSRRGRLLLSSSDLATQAELTRGKAKIAVGAQSTQPSLVTLQLTQVPMNWLQPLLSKVWPDATLNAGHLNARFEIPIDADATRVSGEIDAQTLGFDTKDGRIAGSGLAFSGSLALGFGAAFDVALEGQLRGAELLVGSTYLELPPAPIDLAFSASNEKTDIWTVSRAHWRDAEILQLDGEARLDLAAEPWQKGTWISQIKIGAKSTKLEDASARYLQSLWATAGMPKAALQGAASLDIDMAGTKRLVASITVNDVNLDSGDGRLRAAGLNGKAYWTTEDAAQASRFGWNALAIYGIALGAADVEATSRRGSLQLSSPVTLDAVGGTLEIQKLHWQANANPTADASRFELSLALANLDLASLSAQFGWPAFAGKLSGRLPSASYANETLNLDGGLEIQVFDGHLRVDSLALERPFGVAPTLSANIALRDLDLQPLTTAFGFGEITGRMDGDIRSLRLVDWEPVAFDAQFHTVTRKGVKRRISQRAVNDLSSVGGGFTGGLQSSALSVFDSFGYSQIGLGCRLRNNVCEMSGIRADEGVGGEAGSSNASYTVVEGSGLPRITVNGFARKVDWPVLVARLKAVSDGQSPRIE